MQLFFREGFNYLDGGFPGAPGHVGDFLCFYFSNFEHCTICVSKLFRVHAMPSHHEKNKFPGAPGMQMLQVQAHLYSLARLVFVNKDQTCKRVQMCLNLQHLHTWRAGKFVFLMMTWHGMNTKQFWNTNRTMFEVRKIKAKEITHVTRRAGKSTI